MATNYRQTIGVGRLGEWDDGFYTGIRKIKLSYGDAIGFFQVVYDLNGQSFPGSEHGTSPDSFVIVEIELEFPEELIECVSGYTGQEDVVRSLKFTTNKRTYGPFGVEEGIPFNFPIENGLIVGFKGASGGLPYAIGFHISPFQIQADYKPGTNNQTIVVGPWGLQGPSDWDDGPFHNGILKVILSYGEAIGSFQAIYDVNGHPFPGPVHGSPLHPFMTIELEEGEFIVSVSGYTGRAASIADTNVVRSLTFQTNKRTYGPYGDKEGIPFNFPIKRGRVVGFKGASGRLLKAIGLHIK